MSTPIVEALFGTGAKAKVMQQLYLRKEGSPSLAARALAREADVPMGSIAKTLAQLVDDQLVVREETPDGPRYKALGNSMAVPVMHWIGSRIAQVDAITRSRDAVAA